MSALSSFRRGAWLTDQRRRAGVPPRSEQLKELVKSAINASAVEIFGFYSRQLSLPARPDYTRAHIRTDFGQSYAATSLSSASDYFHSEIDCVNTAAQVARSLGAKGDWVLSVGATPTAHAATQNGAEELNGLEGDLEL